MKKVEDSPQTNPSQDAELGSDEESDSYVFNVEGSFCNWSKQELYSYHFLDVIEFRHSFS